MQRPRLVADWSAGDDTDGRGRARSTPTWPGSPSCGAGWRRPCDADPPQRAPPRHARPAARGPRRRSTCPTRLSLFGHTRLPVTEIELLGALGEHRDVHLWLPHPSDALWRALAGEAAGGPVPRSRRHHAPARRPPPAGDARPRRPRAPARPGDRAHGADDRPVTEPPRPTRCSGWLQADLRANAVGAARRGALRADDRSVQVHACHGVARQVDVLREVLLGLLADDPTLEPRDILVMCPDIETYAPLIAAGFGLGDVVGDDGAPGPPAAGPAGRPGADPDQPAARRGRPSCSTWPAAAPAPATCSTWPTPSRCAAGSASPTTTSSSSTTWVREAGRPLGLRRRAPRRLRALRLTSQNTWRFGLDRVLAGVAMSDDSRRLAGPHASRSTTSAAGRSTWSAGSPSTSTGCGRSPTDLVGTPPARPLARRRWAAGSASLTAVAAQRRVAGRPGAARARPGRAEAAGGLGGTELRLPDVRALLGRPARRAGRPAPTSAPARSPSARWCRCARCRTAWSACSASTTASSRARRAVDGDDVLARRPAAPASATSAARTASCCSTRCWPRPRRWWSPTPAPTSTPASRGRPPYRSASCSTPSTRPPTAARSACRGRHRPPPAPAVRRPQRLARRARARARRSPSTAPRSRAPRGRRAARPAPAPFLDGPLTPRPAAGRRRARRPGRASSSDPVQGFLRARLDVALAAGARTGHRRRCPSRSTTSPSGRSATGCCATCSPASTPTAPVKQREWRRGVLPPGQLGWRMLGQILDRAAPLAEAAAGAAHRRQPARRRRRRRPRRRPPAARHRPGGVRRPAGAGHLLPARRQAPPRVVGPAARADAPSDQDRNWTAHTARPARTAAPATSRRARRCSARSTHTARDVLRDLVALRDRGLREPLPLPLKASFALRPRAPYPRRRGRALRKAGYDWKDAQLPRRAVRARPRCGSGAAGDRPTVLDRAPAAGRGVRRRDQPVRRARAARVEPAARGRAGELVIRTSLRPRRPAADRHHAARGQRRHRQDLHRRRAGHPLRRRGQGDRSTSCW